MIARLILLTLAGALLVGVAPVADIAEASVPAETVVDVADEATIADPDDGDDGAAAHGRIAELPAVDAGEAAPHVRPPRATA